MHLRVKRQGLDPGVDHKTDFRVGYAEFAEQVNLLAVAQAKQYLSSGMSSMMIYQSINEQGEATVSVLDMKWLVEMISPAFSTMEPD